MHTRLSTEHNKHLEHSARAGSRIAAVLIGLIVLSVALILWQYFGMEKVLELSPASGPAVEVVAIDDRAQQGDSVAALTRTSDALIIDCALRATFRYPYCGFQFTLSRDDKGVDLASYDSVTFDVAYEGPGDHKVRFFVHNFEPGLSKLDDYMSQKVSEVELALPRQGTVTLPVSIVRIARWWTDLRNTPLLNTDTRIDNVTAIDLVFGSPETAGRHRVALRSVKFHGKLIRQNNLLLILMSLWILCALVWLAYALSRYRAQLRRSASQLLSLTQLNNALELETRELAGQVYTDSLTGALNREGLRDALINKWKYRGPHNDQMAVVFIDLDHFKRVNDTHGHATGDEVLRAFAMAVQREIRSSDKLVRWGGEEFLIVCLGTGKSEAQGLAEKLRTAMGVQSWPCSLQMTASFGVTALKLGEDIGEAIKRADGALYQAKSSGRNCVQVA